MNVLAIIDYERRQEEGPAIADILSGLQQDECTLVELLPESRRNDDQVEGLVTEHPLSAPMPPGWLQRQRVQENLIRDLGRDLPDVIVAFGESAAAMGNDLANEIERPLLVECWHARHAKRPPVRPQRVTGYFTASEGLANVMRERRLHELIATIPFPVSTPDDLPTDMATAPSIAILDTDIDPNAAQQIIDGLKIVIERIPDLQICLEVQEAGGARIWRHAERIGILDRISSIRNASLVGPLVSDCTLTIMASSDRRSRSVTDLAMSRGRVVLRADHPMLSDLERSSQYILMEASADHWAQAIFDLLADADTRSALGNKARLQIEERNEPQMIKKTWKSLLEEAVGNVTYPFDNKGSTATTRSI